MKNKINQAPPERQQRAKNACDARGNSKTDSLLEGVVVRERIHVRPRSVKPLLRHDPVDGYRSRVILGTLLGLSAGLASGLH